MGDDDDRRVGAKRTDRLDNARFACRVERAGRFVEDQKPRSPQHRARDRDALALAAGQRLPAVADRGFLVPAGLARTSSAASASSSARHNWASSMVSSASRRLAAMRVVEQEGFLRDQRDMLLPLRHQRSSSSASPSTIILPLAGGRSPEMMSSNVDLPEPLGPLIAVIACAGIKAETRSRVGASSGP
jgi:hypothetical protein